MPQEQEPEETWKKCKLLGSKLDHTEDIKSRKGRSLDTLKKLKDIFKSKHLSIKTKIKHFNTYISSIFLYNSELWSLTHSEENSIDAFHRRLLRIAINKQWPKKQQTNEELYETTGTRPWSQVIKHKRLNWTGHLLRLDKRTPARLALSKFLEPHTAKVGRPKNTWMNTLRRDITTITPPKNNNEMMTMLENMATNRNEWKAWVEGECGTVRKD